MRLQRRLGLAEAAGLSLSIVAPPDIYGNLGTIGSLALILVYVGVTLAQAAFARSNRGLIGFIAGCAGTSVLIWPLYNSLYPVPAWPGSLWPYVVLAWLAAGTMFTRTLAR